MSIWKYLLSSPPAAFRYFWPLLLISIALIAGAALLKFYFLPKQNKTLRGLIKDYPGRIATVSVLVILMLIARRLHMSILSARIILFALLALQAYFVINPIYIYKTIYPQKLERNSHKKASSKYLPKKKKKRR